MNPLRRAVLAGPVLLALAAFGVAPATVAQSYPSKPIRMLVPFPAGGGTDFVARTLAQQLAGPLGQQIVVENRAGASGMIGVEAAARSPADGYTVLIAGVGELTINPSLYRKVPYDTLKDFRPVSLVAKNPLMLVVNPAVLPVATLREVIAAAKASPGRITYASFGPGSIAHVTGELFARRAGIQIVHVPYKGAAPALQDLVGGQVAMMFLDYSTAKSQFGSGKVRAIAVSTRERHPALPDIPSVHEAGLENFDAYSWIGAAVPAGTPNEVATKLEAEIINALNSPELRQRFSDYGVLPMPSGAERYAQFIRQELERWGDVVKSLDIVLE